MATELVTPAALRPTFRFSGIWFRIPLDDDAAMAKSVTALIKQLAGADDRHAVGRVKLRHDVLNSVAQARQLGATEVYLAEQVADGIPVSGVLTVHRATPRLSVAVGTSGQAVMDAFVEGLDRTGHSLPNAERFAVGESQVYRSFEVVSAHPADMLTVRFWVTVPETKTIMPLTFATPFPDLVEPLLVLFTAIVATLEWRKGK